MKPIIYAQILILFQEKEWNMHTWCIACSENISCLLLIVVCFCCYLLYIQNTQHDSYQIYQLSSIGKCNFFGTILLTMSHNHTVPNQVTATAGDLTVDSVSVTWTKPNGTITGYEITCSSGSASPSSGDETLTEASCTNLTAGEEYTMTITSISNGVKNAYTISLRACKKCLAFFFICLPALKIAASKQYGPDPIDWYSVCFLFILLISSNPQDFCRAAHWSWFIWLLFCLSFWNGKKIHLSSMLGDIVFQHHIFPVHLELHYTECIWHCINLMNYYPMALCISLLRFF